MIFSLTQATRLAAERSLQLVKEPSATANTQVAIPPGRNYQATPVGSGMFGLLVHRDAVRGRWF